jgi:hypothetical protein
MPDVKGGVRFSLGAKTMLQALASHQHCPHVFDALKRILAVGPPLCAAGLPKLPLCLGFEPSNVKVAPKLKGTLKGRFASAFSGWPDVSPQR